MRLSQAANRLFSPSWIGDTIGVEHEVQLISRLLDSATVIVDQLAKCYCCPRAWRPSSSIAAARSGAESRYRSAKTAWRVDRAALTREVLIQEREEVDLRDNPNALTDGCAAMGPLPQLTGTPGRGVVRKNANAVPIRRCATVHSEVHSLHPDFGGHAVLRPVIILAVVPFFACLTMGPVPSQDKKLDKKDPLQSFEPRSGPPRGRSSWRSSPASGTW